MSASPASDRASIRRAVAESSTTRTRLGLEDAATSVRRRHPDDDPHRQLVDARELLRAVRIADLRERIPGGRKSVDHRSRQLKGEAAAHVREPGAADHVRELANA